ncbi:MAG TPA: TolC family protein [Burkholderiales bacterium]|nr:TolC family protein [Burkholderiales bacterium]
MRSLVSILALATLAGCASAPTPEGFRDVEQLVTERTGARTQWNRGADDDRAAAEAVQRLLEQPLAADDAVQVALLNNRGLQASYGELGVAQADLVQAGLLRNPVFRASRIRSSDLVTTGLGVEFDFLGLLLRPRAREIEAARVESLKLRVADEVLRVAAEVRVGYYRALASAQSAAIQQSMLAAAEAAAELAARQYNAGNLNLRDQARRQVAYVEARAQLARERQREANDRERMNRLLGLSGAQTAWRLPQKLPEPPRSRPDYGDLERLAIVQRLDVGAARRDVEYVGKVLGITRSTRYLAVLDLGIDWEKDSGEPAQVGPTLRLELPLFDQGQARIARYEALFRGAAERLSQVATDARSEAREKQGDLHAAWEISRQHAEALVPLRGRILAQTQLFYNGMLEGVYDLLADYRESAAAAQALVEAQRDYWIALAELERAVGGRLPPPGPAVSDAPPPTESGGFDAKKPSAHDHH